MRRLHRLTLPLLAAALMGLPGSAHADKKGGGTGDITQICEKEKVQKCTWVGQQKVCEWVDGPNCAVVRVQPGGNVRATPGKLRLQR